MKAAVAHPITTPEASGTLISVTEDELDELQAEFDRRLAEHQQCDTDIPADAGDAVRQDELRAQVREWGQALEAAGRIPPGQPWWLRLQVITYNLHNYSSPDAADRAEQRALIRSLNADILCLQEIRHITDDPHDRELSELFHALCSDLGMEGRLAFARSGHHVAVLWQPELRLISWTDYRRWPWHHGCGVAELDIGARQPLQVVAAHFSPFSPDQRAHEAQLLGALAPAQDRWMIVGADLNAPSVQAPEPYDGQDPRGRHQLHQRIVSPIWPADSETAPVDRRAAMILDRHRLRDLADRGPHKPWPMTTGHHPADPHGPRQPDCLRTTPELQARAGGLLVHDTTEARLSSDHLPLSTVLTVPWRPTFRPRRTASDAANTDSGASS